MLKSTSANLHTFKPRRICGIIKFWVTGSRLDIRWSLLGSSHKYGTFGIYWILADPITSLLPSPLSDGPCLTPNQNFRGSGLDKPMVGILLYVNPKLFWVMWDFNGLGFFSTIWQIFWDGKNDSHIYSNINY
jgi:hypothetical protein